MNAVMDDELLFRVLRGRATPEEGDRVSAWRMESPEHDRRYRELTVILNAALHSEPLPDTSPPAPLRVIHRARSRVIEQAGSQVHGSRTRSWQRWIQVAAAAAFVLYVGSTLRPDEAVVPRVDELTADEFVTGASETATVTLRDGTVVRLAPSSRLQLTAGVQGRRVTLHGQAFFAVAKDPSRPFVIDTGSGRVEVLGTRFDMRAGDEEVRVVVVEGRVSLRGRSGGNEVRAGELGRIVEGTALRPVAVADADEIAPWMGSFLAFQETPLRDAAREIEQLYDVRIEIADSSVAVQTITTWFADQSIDRVMEVFCMVAEADCSTEPGIYRVASRRRQ